MPTMMIRAEAEAQMAEEERLEREHRETEAHVRAAREQLRREKFDKAAAEDVVSKFEGKDLASVLSEGSAKLAKVRVMWAERTAWWAED